MSNHYVRWEGGRITASGKDVPLWNWDGPFENHVQAVDWAVKMSLDPDRYSVERMPTKPSVQIPALETLADKVTGKP